jgi:hypothetical protein
MWSWQAVVILWGPWAIPLMTMPHDPQIPSRQSCSKAMGSPPSRVISSFTRSSMSRKDMLSETSRAS